MLIMVLHLYICFEQSLLSTQARPGLLVFGSRPHSSTWCDLCTV